MFLAENSHPEKNSHPESNSPPEFRVWMAIFLAVDGYSVFLWMAISAENSHPNREEADFMAK